METEVVDQLLLDFESLATFFTLVPATLLAEMKKILNLWQAEIRMNLNYIGKYLPHQDKIFQWSFNGYPSALMRPTYFNLMPALFLK